MEQKPGFPCLLESPGFFCKISRTWKVLETDFGPGKSWNLVGCGCENIHVCTPPVYVIHSYMDKTFLFATCDSDEHCSMDATVTLLYVE